jgi:hypothetical protein
MSVIIPHASFSAWQIALASLIACLRRAGFPPRRKQRGFQPRFHEGTTLQAPLRIMNQAGAVLLEVQEKPHDLAVRLFNAQGIAVATLGVDGTHAGYLAIRNAGGQSVAALDVELSGARLQVYDQARRGGVVLFGGDSGENAGGGLHILHTGSGNGISISVWSNQAGGEIRIYDAQTDELLLDLPQRPA